MAASTIGLYNAPEMNQLRLCARTGLELSNTQCTTDSCLCQLQDLPAILQAVSAEVNSQCSSNSYDATTAMYAVISYCTAQGYPVASSLSSITTSPGTLMLLFLPLDSLTVIVRSHQPIPRPSVSLMRPKVLRYPVAHKYHITWPPIHPVALPTTVSVGLMLWRLY